MAHEKLNEWLNNIVQHIVETSKKRATSSDHKGKHQYDVSFNPRLQEFGALCKHCNKWWYIRLADVPEQWKEFIDDREKLANYLNALNSFDDVKDQLPELYAIATVMES